MIPNESVLTIALSALGLYFSVLLIHALVRYVRFRSLRETALVSWPGPRMPHAGLLLVLGIVAGAVALLNAWTERPLHHVYSQGVMSAYFILSVLLTEGVRPGCYRDGIWAEGGFLRYSDVARMSFRETPEIMLVLLPRNRSVPLRLRIPPGEYGTVRKVLGEQVRARVLTLDEGLLDL